MNLGVELLTLIERVKALDKRVEELERMVTQTNPLNKPVPTAQVRKAS